ncbi:MAG: LPS export ABC transporter periplasmic protein LptC [Candidatus Marinimicrobia bacterium]|nr:LPS export ABC transporter periplasmic protein LptC [Candidatus Neomarinimicrobiota bacterium]
MFYKYLRLRLPYEALAKWGAFALNVLVLSFFVFSSSFFSCSRQDLSIPEDIDIKLPDQESWNFSFSLSNEGRKSIEINAGHMLKFENEGLTYLGDSMQVDYFDQDGFHISCITSDSGIINEKQEHLTAIGNVIMISDSGYTMLTDKVFWRNDSNIVYTPGNITLYSENDTLYGTGFTSDVKLENWTIFKPTGKTYRELEK